MIARSRFKKRFTSKKRSLSPVEDQIQMAVVEWARYHPILKTQLLCHEHKRICSPQYRKKLEAMGCIWGECDLFLALPRINYAGYFLEVKAHNKKPTKRQCEFMENMRKAGYAADYFDSVDNGIELIKNYLSLGERDGEF